MENDNLQRTVTCTICNNLLESILKGTEISIFRNILRKTHFSVYTKMSIQIYHGHLTLPPRVLVVGSCVDLHHTGVESRPERSEFTGKV